MGCTDTVSTVGSLLPGRASPGRETQKSWPGQGGMQAKIADLLHSSLLSPNFCFAHELTKHLLHANKRAHACRPPYLHLVVVKGKPESLLPAMCTYTWVYICTVDATFSKKPWGGRITCENQTSLRAGNWLQGCNKWSRSVNKCTEQIGNRLGRKASSCKEFTHNRQLAGSLSQWW